MLQNKYSKNNFLINYSLLWSDNVTFAMGEICVLETIPETTVLGGV